MPNDNCYSSLVSLITVVETFLNYTVFIGIFW